MDDYSPSPQRSRTRNNRANNKQWSRNHPYLKDLDERESLFIEAYFTNGRNVLDAAEEAGFPRSGEVLRRPHVAQAVYERAQYEKLAAPELINMVVQVARFDQAQIHTIESNDVITEEEQADGSIKRVVTTYKTVKLDLVKAIEEGHTYAIKSIEYFRDGTAKKVVAEDKMEAIRLLGAAFGLFGLDKGKENDGKSWQERALAQGLDPRTVVEEMERIAEEWKAQMPRLTINGNITEDAIIDSNDDNPD